MKTTLTVNVEYDPAMTDPEGLAAAMDRLLEIALSTPGVLEDYGTPVIGEFLVAPEQPKEQLADPLVVVNVFGGIVQGVFSSVPDAQVIVVDWDCDGCDPSEPGIVKVEDGQQRTQLVHVDQSPASPLCQAAATDVEAAIEAAGLELPLCECERPGYFFSGVPGILAHLEDGRLAAGAEVQRCDLCQRYPSDEAALGKLRELGSADAATRYVTSTATAPAECWSPATASASAVAPPNVTEDGREIPAPGSGPSVGRTPVRSETRAR